VIILCNANLSGYSMNTEYKRFLVAPHSVRTGLVERIEREIDNQLAGRPSGIRFKCNSIVDEGIIDALYRASQAGVKVDIWVRGICAIRAGVPGLSENIRAISILGRFLEHSRVFMFENGGNREAWIGSADLMHRNLDRRVETLVSLVDPEQIADLEALFDMAFDPITSAWDLQPDGEWVRRLTDRAGDHLVDFQEALIDIKLKRGFAP